jgi:hypothetical protein
MDRLSENPPDGVLSPSEGGEEEGEGVVRDW